MTIQENGMKTKQVLIAISSINNIFTYNQYKKKIFLDQVAFDLQTKYIEELIDRVLQGKMRALELHWTQNKCY
jgi:hypothetical protein